MAALCGQTSPLSPHKIARLTYKSRRQHCTQRPVSIATRVNTSETIPADEPRWRGKKKTLLVRLCPVHGNLLRHKSAVRARSLGPRPPARGQQTPVPRRLHGRSRYRRNYGSRLLEPGTWDSGKASDTLGCAANGLQEALCGALPSRGRSAATLRPVS